MFYVSLFLVDKPTTVANHFEIICALLFIVLYIDYKAKSPTQELLISTLAEGDWTRTILLGTSELSLKSHSEPRPIT